MQKLAAADQGLSGALGRLMVVSEAYPDLKANQNMMQLSEELTSTENRVAFARQAFNDSVMAYNNRREVFPSSVVAGMFNFAAAALLEITEPAKREAPKVSVLNFFERQDAGPAPVPAPGAPVRAGRAGDRRGRGRGRCWPSSAASSEGQGALATPARSWLATVVTLGVIGCASLFRIASLRTGGAAVAQQLGATPVPEDTTDFNLRRLRNVVEEIAIASGVPVPQIFVLEDESAINAFAAGYAPSDAGDHRHPRRAQPAQPRRAAGRDRARVQPRAQRRHAPEHPPDRAAVRHPGAGADRPQDPRARPLQSLEGRRRR